MHKLADLGARTERRTRIKGKTMQRDKANQDKTRYKVEATAEQIVEAPVSNLGHRIWKCQAEYMAKLRERWAAPCDRAKPKDTRPGREHCSPDQASR